MCGKYGGPPELEVFAGYFKVAPLFQDKSVSDECQPMKMVNVFAKNSEGVAVLKEMKWGLIPASFTGAVGNWSASTFYARLETVARTASFENAWERKRRVIFPMAYFSEKVSLPADRAGGKVKQGRVAITRADDKPLGVAGIYDYAQTLDGPVLSVAMLTRQPGARMSSIHDREPVVIEPEKWQDWLDGSDKIDLATPWGDGCFNVSAAI